MCAFQYRHSFPLNISISDLLKLKMQSFWIWCIEIYSQSCLLMTTAKLIKTKFVI